MRTREIPREMILRLHRENRHKQLSMSRTLENTHARDKTRNITRATRETNAA